MKTPAVVRSPVPTKKSYKEYREPLRLDFFWSCAYCTRAESEAATISYEIDHYEPRSLPDGALDAYDNLMWCCELCNSRKSDLAPPVDAVAAGVRLFRPDHDVHDDHFNLANDSVRLSSATPTGDFTIEALDLNRKDLRDLRRDRRALYRNEAAVTAGLQAIRTARIDRLAPEVRFRLQRILTDLARDAALLAAEIDNELLRMLASSPNLDPLPPDEERANEERVKALRKRKAVFPGAWSARARKKQPAPPTVLLQNAGGDGEG